jgi:pyruvate formate-lyase activating enzyme-like uncharacterized protein
MSKIEKTRFYSKKIGDLCEGCKRCVKGEKLVLFVTGICPKKCNFCPISDYKFNNDVIFANEKEIKDENDIQSIIKEAKLCNSTGAGITGGDPLSKTKRTIKYIKELKKEYKNSKEKFHIHLYTSLDLVNNDNLRELYFAGLDEIRFHMDLDNTKLWDKLNLAMKYNWKIGVEIPVIPTKEIEIKKLIEFIEGKVHFINLNELEVADNKMSKLTELGFKTKNKTSYAIKGSEEIANKILSYVKENNIHINVHYCTVKLKDKVQLGNRIKKRSKNIKKDFDKLTKEGLLVRGVIYPKGFEPGFSYQKKIKEMISEKTIKSLIKTKETIKTDFKIKENQIFADEKKLRILTSTNIVKKLSKKIKNKCAIVTEYPTDDSLEIEIEFLN